MSYMNELRLLNIIRDSFPDVLNSVLADIEQERMQNDQSSDNPAISSSLAATDTEPAIPATVKIHDGSISNSEMEADETAQLSLQSVSNSADYNKVTDNNWCKHEPKMKKHKKNSHNLAAKSSPFAVSPRASSSSNEPSGSTETIRSPTESLLPPIFIHDKASWVTINAQLQTERIVYSSARNSPLGIRIQVATADDHVVFTEFLRANNIRHHVYALGDERLLKVVVRGIPKRLATDMILEDLNTQGLPALKVHRMVNEFNRKPYNMVLVVLENTLKAETIFCLKKICQVNSFTVEYPRNILCSQHLQSVMRESEEHSSNYREYPKASPEPRGWEAQSTHKNLSHHASLTTIATIPTTLPASQHIPQVVVTPTTSVAAPNIKPSLEKIPTTNATSLAADFKLVTSYLAGIDVEGVKMLANKLRLAQTPLDKFIALCEHINVFESMTQINES